MTKSEILEWYKKNHSFVWVEELSDMLDKLIEGAPGELVQCSKGYICHHMQMRNEQWKKEAKG